MFMLDNVAKPLPHEKYPLVTYKKITCQIYKHMGGKNIMSTSDLKYITKINHD